MWGTSCRMSSHQRNPVLTSQTSTDFGLFSPECMVLLHPVTVKCPNPLHQLQQGEVFETCPCNAAIHPRVAALVHRRCDRRCKQPSCNVPGSRTQQQQLFPQTVHESTQPKHALVKKQDLTCSMFMVQLHLAARRFQHPDFQYKFPLVWKASHYVSRYHHRCHQSPAVSGLASGADRASS